MEETEGGGEMREGEWKHRGREWTVWTFLAAFPWPLQSLDLTSHVIRGCVNQQLGAQMKGCQLLPGAQQATEHSSRGRIPYVTVTLTHTPPHTLTIKQPLIWQENATACLNQTHPYIFQNQNLAETWHNSTHSSFMLLHLEMKCIEILETEKHTASLRHSYAASQPETLWSSSDTLVRLQGSRRLGYVTFCDSHTEPADHNVTALRGIGTTHPKREMSHSLDEVFGLPAWKMGNGHQGGEKSSSKPPGNCLL